MFTSNININIQGNGDPLVLFHGWGFDSKIWSPLLPKLSEKYQLYLIDLPGFGLTSSMEWAVFKAKVLKLLPIKFAVAGWSMGGLYATRLAVEEPQHVTHLINISSSPHFVRETDWPGIDVQVIETFYRNLAHHPQQILAEFIQLQLQGQAMPDIAIGSVPSVVGLQAGLELLVHWDLRQELATLTIPVCYMFGRLDAIISRITMATMQKIYPQFHYIMFAKAAHVPFLSHPTAFITALEEFLK